METNTDNKPKLFDKKRIRTMVISGSIGVVFSGYLFYEQKGFFDMFDLIILGITSLFVAILFFVMIKFGNK